MCGIFGFIGAPGADLDNSSVQQAIRSLIRLSEPRGREASGIAVVLPGEIAVYRRALAPSRILRHPEFAQVLDDVLPPGGRSAAAAEFAVLGHCRLVTNGTQAIESNNQPVLLDRVVGVHNGIVTNPHDLLADEDFVDSIELDSEALFRHLERQLQKRASLCAALQSAFGALAGEASIAMFAREENQLVVGTNSGCLYVAARGPLFVWTSERYSLESFLTEGHFGLTGTPVRHLRAGQALIVPLDTAQPAPVTLPPPASGVSNPSALATSTARATTAAARHPQHADSRRTLVDRTHGQVELRRCTRCILPATYPFITFDQDGICNYCHTHLTQRVQGREALLKELDRHRRGDGQPDCIVAFSGGRDSSYGLHLLKNNLGMTPLAFTYDWGLVSDLARRNQARMCGTLGVEHVIRAADISAQRRYIRRNLEAWLARPRLGMIPIFMAGDKFFYSHARDLRRETGIPLVIFCSGNDLERTPFKTGFAGVRENNYSNRLFALEFGKKLQLGAYYAAQLLANPRYFNESLLNSARAFAATFVGIDDFLYLYNFEPWDEATIDRTLIGTYDWEISPESSNTWRIGDGYTAFINYVYHRVAGFSEFDVFRSHQIRDGIIDRPRALTLAAEDNRPRLGELREFARLIGFNLEDVLSRIDELPRIPPRA
jgi:glucosamine--fructose-6-phosphate aminotransferase (isomerizing)